MRLAKLGYYGGDPEKVLNAPANIICDIISIEDVQNRIDQFIYNKDDK